MSLHAAMLDSSDFPAAGAQDSFPSATGVTVHGSILIGMRIGEGTD
jgi:hypothetical protein